MIALQPLLNVDPTESWRNFYWWVPNDQFSTAYFLVSMEADTNTAHQIW